MIAHYDITRLVRRRYRDNPTGIDRIDVAFARATFEALGARCWPVMVDGNRPVVMDRTVAATFLSLLDSHWRRAGLDAAAHPGRFLDASGHVLPALTEGVRLRPLLARTVRVVTERLRSHRIPDGTDVLYVNVGHGGLLRSHGPAPWSPLPPPAAAIVYIHDTLPLTHPDLFSPEAVAGFRRFLEAVRSMQPVVAANSEATADALEAAGLSGRPLVIRPGVEAIPGIRREALADTVPRFAVIGTIEPRKNHAVLFRAWQRLLAAGMDPMPSLDVVGRPGWNAQETLSFLAGAEAARLGIHAHGGVDDETLSAILSRCRALLVPSLAEGFGLPFAEAAAAGIPVIAADLPVYREIAASGVTYLDPHDDAAWAGAVASAVRAEPPPPRLAPGLTGWTESARRFCDLVAAHAAEG